MITNFFIPELNNHDVQELWFQQDGATCHTARATIDLLKDTFGDRLITRFGPLNWPPRSCDLTPLDYFLWGYVKSLVYANKPQTLDHLEDNFRRVIADIRPQMLEKVIENWTTSEPAVAVLCQKSYLKLSHVAAVRDPFRLSSAFSKNSQAAVAEWSRCRIVAALVTSSSPGPLKIRRVGERCTLNLSRVQTSSCWCGVVGVGYQLRCRPRYLTMVQNYVVRR
ncbi:uncharacterized protein TNCV_2707971 [Trichonephila clavipes]|nr:uncharacterized protein TNCV_2707971 [Trichonephila clavipes]